MRIFGNKSEEMDLSSLRNAVISAVNKIEEMTKEGVTYNVNAMLPEDTKRQITAMVNQAIMDSFKQYAAEMQKHREDMLELIEMTNGEIAREKADADDAFIKLEAQTRALANAVSNVPSRAELQEIKESIKSVSAKTDDALEILSGLVEQESNLAAPTPSDEPADAAAQDVQEEPESEAQSEPAPRPAKTIVSADAPELANTQEERVFREQMKSELQDAIRQGKNAGRVIFGLKQVWTTPKRRAILNELREYYTTKNQVE